MTAEEGLVHSDIALAQIEKFKMEALIDDGQHCKTWKGSFGNVTATVKVFSKEYKKQWENEKDILDSGLSHENILKVLIKLI